MQANTLSKASATGDLPMVFTLLENGADVNGFNRYGRTPLQVVNFAYPDVVKSLLVAGALPNVRDPVLSLTVLHDAARAGYLDSVRVLVEHGADVNLVDEKGNLPLHLAAEEGNLQVVELLLGLTADPRTPNADGHTAGRLARTKGKGHTADYIDHYLSSTPVYYNYADDTQIYVSLTAD